MIHFRVFFSEQRQNIELRFNETNNGFRAAFAHHQVATQLVGGELYDGEYTVVPSVRRQTLDTRQKSMRDDVTVLEIPYAEVTNSANGITATIG